MRGLQIVPLLLGPARRDSQKSRFAQSVWSGWPSCASLRAKWENRTRLGEILPAEQGIGRNFTTASPHFQVGLKLHYRLGRYRQSNSRPTRVTPDARLAYLDRKDTEIAQFYRVPAGHRIRDVIKGSLHSL